MNKCEFCNKTTLNPKFCSRSCAAKFNNSKFPKRTKKKFYCQICGLEVPTRNKYCEEHNINKIDWNSVTYKELTSTRNYQKNSRIRSLARPKFLKSNKHVCANCGYDKHVEVCHIKPINEHSPDTKIAEINDLSNLIGLCPNCHWELDNGHLRIEDIQKSN